MHFPAEPHWRCFRTSWQWAVLSHGAVRSLCAREAWHFRLRSLGGRRGHMGSHFLRMLRAVVFHSAHRRPPRDGVLRAAEPSTQALPPPSPELNTHARTPPHEITLFFSASPLPSPPPPHPRLPLVVSSFTSAGSPSIPFHSILFRVLVQNRLLCAHRVGATWVVATVVSIAPDVPLSPTKLPRSLQLTVLKNFPRPTRTGHANWTLATPYNDWGGWTVTRNMVVAQGRRPSTF